ncbi:DP-EP family protein [Permianibacter aggregans]|uniref:Uncharacterized protein DUF1888 n=1 Tax=Permianibacter aggregans TaxID=1510150 RepID=A0A4R6ULC6_9GAMM|nr:DP-EP family protein [Permianibacter aggregans]QGX39841.1 DP-EP family protein [Permianibacter aggregans]TDQ45935.1 uncharacterized protein DUF1888 [Permianibacter aggregans]
MSLLAKKNLSTVQVSVDFSSGSFSYSGGTDGHGNVTTTSPGDVTYTMTPTTDSSLRFVGAVFLNPSDADIGRIKVVEGGRSLKVFDNYENPNDTISFLLVVQNSANPPQTIISADPQIINHPKPPM